jgi:hypothetical protein
MRRRLAGSSSAGRAAAGGRGPTGTWRWGLASGVATETPCTECIRESGMKRPGDDAKRELIVTVGIKLGQVGGGCAIQLAGQPSPQGARTPLPGGESVSKCPPPLNVLKMIHVRS